MEWSRDFKARKSRRTATWRQGVFLLLSRVGAAFSPAVTTNASRWLRSRPVPCACRKSSSEVLMVKSTEKWPGSNTARGMDGTRQRSILAEAIGASGPGCNRPRKTAADGEDAAPRTRRHGPSNRVGSNRSPFHNIHSATATAARLADPECSSPEGGG